jgi:probable F420-dependent oxidoreductase
MATSVGVTVVWYDARASASKRRWLLNTRVELGVAIPQAGLTAAPDPRTIREFVARAEELGFTSGWVLEQILGTMPTLEPIEVLTYAAACTERLKLGTAVLLTGLRGPVHLAKTLTTLDRLSGGRLIVGVGLGAASRIDPATWGIGAERRAARFAEGLRIVKRLWTEPRVTFAGEFWRLDNVAMEPKPVQKPHPPVWFGAHHPNALKRAVELGDGFMGAGSVSTATFAEEVAQIRRLLADAGRDPARFGIGKRVYIAIDRDRERAARRLGEFFAAFYRRPELTGEVAVYGDVDTCVEGLRRVLDAGARMLLLNPVTDELEHLERFAAEVAPKL